MSDIFISYSRKDGEFMRHLHNALSARKRDIWVDWEDIPLTADWWKEICAAIESADAFTFIISPDSVVSDICRDEINYALANNKRFIPILHRDISAIDKALVHPAIQAHNWIIFKDRDFDGAVTQLLQALDTDLNHVHLHTRLLLRAKEWESKARHADYLLNRGELDEYNRWLLASQTKDPKPNELQLEYILASQEAHNRRQRRFFISAIALLSFFLVLAALSFLLTRQLAQANAQATEGALFADRLRQTSEAGETAIALQLANNATSEAGRLTQVANDSALRLTQVAEKLALNATLGEQATRLADNRTQIAQAQATGVSALGTLTVLIPQSTQLASENAALIAQATQSFYAQNTQIAVEVAALFMSTAYIPEAIPTESPEEGLSDDSTASATATASPTPSLTASPQPPTATVTPSPTPIPALAGQWFVSPQGDDENPCYNPVVPCASIGAAVAKAQDGDTVHIAVGVYNETLLLEKDITLDGENIDLTVINGGGGGSVVTIAADAIVTIRDLTITGGNSASDGGGILNYGALTGRNLYISANVAAGNGGGIANYGTLTLTDADLDSNSARVAGAVYNAPDAIYRPDGILTSNNTEAAQADDCPALVQAAISLSSAVCQAAQRNRACYVSGPLTAEVREGARFEAAGDIIPLTDLRRLQLAPPNEQNGTWGVVLLQTQADLPNVLPGQNVTIVLYGASNPEGETIAQNAIMVTSAANVNLREGPGLNYNRLLAGAIPANTRLPADAISDDGGWVRVTYEGQVGWVSKSLLIRPLARPLLMTTAVNPALGEGAVNMRRGPGPNYEVARALAVNTPILVDAFSDDLAWARVVVGRLEVGGQAIVRVTNDTLNLRQNPSTNAPLVAELESGTTLTLLEGPIEADGFSWWRIRTAQGQEGWSVERISSGATLLGLGLDSVNVSGWVSRLLIQVTEVTTARNTRLLDAPNGDEVGQILRGTPLQADAISADGAWVRVESATGQAWIPLDTLEPFDTAQLPNADTLLAPDIADQLRDFSASDATLEAYYLLSSLDRLTCAPVPPSFTVRLTDSPLTVNISGDQLTLGE